MMTIRLIVYTLLLVCTWGMYMLQKSDPSTTISYSKKEKRAEED